MADNEKEIASVYVSVIPSMAGFIDAIIKGGGEGAAAYARAFSAGTARAMPSAMAEVNRVVVSATAATAREVGAIQSASLKETLANASAIVNAEVAAQAKITSARAASLKETLSRAGAVVKAEVAAQSEIASAYAAMFKEREVLEAAAAKKTQALQAESLKETLARAGAVVRAEAAAQKEIQALQAASLKETMARAGAVVKAEVSARAEIEAAYATMLKEREVLEAASAKRRQAIQAESLKENLAHAGKVVAAEVAAQQEILAVQQRAHQAQQALRATQANALKDTFARSGQSVNSGFAVKAANELAELEQFKNAWAAKIKATEAATTTGLSGMGIKLLNAIGGPFKLITPLLANEGQQSMKMWGEAATSEMAKSHKTIGSLLDGVKGTFEEKSSAWAGAVKVATKAAWITAGIGVADLVIKDIKNTVEVLNKEVEQFAKVGLDAAHGMMDAFGAAVKGEMPDIMSFFNIAEEGFKAIWEAPQNLFNLFIDNTIGHIPLIGSAVKTVVGEVESAANAIFPIFDQLKEFAGQYLSIMMDVGTQWQEIARTIAGQSLGEEELGNYLSIVKEIAESGLVLHFKDVAQVVGELSQRLDGLDNNAGLTRDQLKELAVTVAEGNELLGNIHINIDGLTAAFNSFGVSAQDTTELLTEFVNISRKTGADINTVIHDVEASGPAFQDLGFNIEDTYFLMAKFNEELGSPAMQRFVLSLRGMPEAFSKLHIDPKEGYKQLVEQIQELTKPGSSALDLEEALNDATRFMSKSAASTFVQGIKLGFSGTPEQIAKALEQWQQGAKSIKQPLEEALEATKSIQDTLEVVSTQFMGLFAPMAKGLADALKDAGNNVTDWIKENQDKIAEWAGEAMHWTLVGIAEVITGVADAFSVSAGMVDTIAKFIIGSLKAIDLGMQGIIKPLSMLPDWMWKAGAAMGGFGIAGIPGGIAGANAMPDHIQSTLQDANKGLVEATGPLNALGSEDFKKDMEGASSALRDMVTTIRSKWIPATDSFAARSVEGAKFNIAMQERITKPGSKESTIQRVLATTGSETYTAPDATKSDLAKIQEIISNLKDVSVQVATGPNGVTLSGSPEDLQRVGGKIHEAGLGVMRGQYAEKDMRLLGGSTEWGDVKTKLHALGIDMDVDMATGVVKGIKAGTEKAGKEFMQWWSDTVGELPPIVAQIEPSFKPAEGGSQLGIGDAIAGALPGHAAGGSVGSDGWVRGSWSQGKDSVPHAMPLGSYVIRRDQAQKHAGLLDRLYPGGTGSGSRGIVPSILEVGERVMPPGGPTPLYNAINYGLDGYQTGGLAHFDTGGDSEDPNSQMFRGFLRGVSKGLGVELPKEKGPAGTIEVQTGPYTGGAASVKPTDSDKYYVPSVGHTGGAEGWRSTVRDLLAQYGPQLHIPPAAYADWENRLVKQINTESHGDANVGANLTDINAQRGHPSVGLLQFIPSTYAAHNVTGRPFPDPIGEIVAAMDYAPRTKDGFPAGGQSGSIGEGHGYATGGLVGFAEGGTDGSGPSPWGQNGDNLDSPQLPDWWRDALSGSLGGRGDSIPIDRAWMPNAGGRTLPPWVGPSHLKGPNGVSGFGACTDPSCTIPGAHYAHGGLVGFRGGGSASGVDEVIWSNTETGQDVGEANGAWVGTPGSSDPGYYHRGKNDFLDHTGHVHTTFTKNPFTGAPYTEVRAGTDIRQGKPGFPSWVYQLGDQFGLEASTYPSHQEWDGVNHGIDWWPKGKGNMTGAGYTHGDRQDLTGFAQAVGSFGVGGAPGGAPGGGGGSDRWGNPQMLGGHGGSAWSGGEGGGGHKPKKVKEKAPRAEGAEDAAGTGAGPGMSSVPNGLMIPEEWLQDVNPYTNLPRGMKPDSEEWQRYKGSFDSAALTRMNKATQSAGAAEAAAKADSDLVTAKDEEKKAHDAWTEYLSHLLPSEKDHPERFEQYPEYKKWKSKEEALKSKEGAAEHAHTRAEQQELEDEVADEKLGPKAPKSGKGGSEGGKYESISEQAGEGLIKGVADELGFKDVFKGKPFWEWGIWKLGAGAASYGLNILNAIGDAQGTGSGLSGLLGGLGGGGLGGLGGASAGDLGIPDAGGGGGGVPNVGQDSSPGSAGGGGGGGGGGGPTPPGTSPGGPGGRIVPDGTKREPWGGRVPPGTKPGPAGGSGGPGDDFVTAMLPPLGNDPGGLRRVKRSIAQEKGWKILDQPAQPQPAPASPGAPPAARTWQPPMPNLGPLQQQITGPDPMLGGADGQPYTAAGGAQFGPFAIPPGLIPGLVGKQPPVLPYTPGQNAIDDALRGRIPTRKGPGGQDEVLLPGGIPAGINPQLLPDLPPALPPNAPITRVPGLPGDTPAPPNTRPSTPFPLDRSGGQAGPTAGGDSNEFFGGYGGGGSGMFGAVAGLASAALSSVSNKYMLGSQGVVGAMRSSSPSAANSGISGPGGSLTVNNTYQGFNPTPQHEEQVRAIANGPNSTSFHMSMIPQAIGA